MANIQLTAAMRSNLLSLQNTQKLMNQTQNRLSTGLKVNSAIDNPSSYFTALGLNQRAGDLSDLLDSMGQGIQTIKAANEGIQSITTLAQQAKSIASQIADGGDVAKLGQQYSDVLDQIDSLAKDASYKGVNLLDSGSLTIKFNESTTTPSSLTIGGVDASSTGIGMTAATGITDAATAATAADAATDAINKLRGFASDFGNNYAIVQARQDFTQNLINVLTEGADSLTLADMNEESANMLALQTRQQLGVNSLSLASQAAQSVLKLF